MCTVCFICIHCVHIDVCCVLHTGVCVSHYCVLLNVYVYSSWFLDVSLNPKKKQTYFSLYYFCIDLAYSLLAS